MRRMVVGALFVFVAATFVAPAFAGTVLKFSSIHEPAHPSAYTAEFFAERVKQMTKGEVEVQVYHSRQLGDARDNVENVRNGSIAFTSVSISNLSQVLPAMDAWSLSFHLQERRPLLVCPERPQGHGVHETARAEGDEDHHLDHLGRPQLLHPEADPYPGGHEGDEDSCDGLAGHDQHHEGLRGQRRADGLGRLYTALQTGVVDGAENNHPSVISMKFYEVSKYYTPRRAHADPDADHRFHQGLR